MNDGEEKVSAAPSEQPQEPAAAEASSPVTAEKPAKLRSAYKHELSHYAGLIGYHVRNIKRWVAVGRDAKIPELPPFDDPPAMLPWWQRMQQAGELKQRPPDRLLAYAQKKPEAAEAAPPADATPNPTPPAAAAPAPAYDFSSATGGGLEESVREFRRILAANQQRLKTAMLAQPLDESFVTSCQRNVEKMLDLLRKAEGDLFEMQRKRGDLVPRAEVRQDWSTLLSSVKMMRQRTADNLCAALEGKLTAEQLALVRAAFDAERGREETILRSSIYWRATDNVSPVAAASA